VCGRNAEFLDEIYRSGASPFMGSNRPQEGEQGETNGHAQIVEQDLATFQQSLPSSHSHSTPHSHSHSTPHSHSHSHSGSQPISSLAPDIPRISTDPPVTTTLDSTQRSAQNVQKLLDRHAGLQRQAKKDNNMDKVRSTLRQMIRDWSEAVSRGLGGNVRIAQTITWDAERVG
jgi:hypothetical protein